VTGFTDTGNEYYSQTRIRGAAGGHAGGSHDGAAGGAAGGADGGVTVGAGDRAAGNPPPPSDPPPLDHRNTGAVHLSRQQRRIKELEFAQPIKIMESKKFYRNAGKDFDTWWVLVQVYIEDQPDNFPKDNRAIDWIGSLMDSYAAFWHIQWIEGTLTGLHLKSVMGYSNAHKLRFEENDAKDEASADVDNVRYEGCIRDMFPKIQTCNDKAMNTGAALKEKIFTRLPTKIIEQMHTVDAMRKREMEINAVICSTRRTAEISHAGRKNLGFKVSSGSYKKKYEKLQRSMD